MRRHPSRAGSLTLPLNLPLAIALPPNPADLWTAAVDEREQANPRLIIDVTRDDGRPTAD